MTTAPLPRRKYETRRRGFKSRLDPKHKTIDTSQWLRPTWVPAPITMPTLPDRGITDQWLGLDPNGAARAEAFLSAAVGKWLRDDAKARQAARLAA
ncbi:hypothetical protein QO001_005046 [Methylobacterium brachiatum]|uniref:Uncharacterized protein n=1 Tax=Methylobacterium brachiatum TaxID=269660 RepID=A0AAJ1TS05_9HYPH|nr:hypothetical protein [Methylobacterium brachiatum]MDQ0546097.1 hypothetical protein [Methylobacterium brachiatum]